MARTTKKPTRRPAGPRNTSRAAGAPAPASAAATAPFYRPETEPAASPPPEAAASYREALERQAVPVDRTPDHTADVTLSPHIQGGGDLSSEVARIRKIRRPLGVYAQKLALDARPGYHRHWFNEVGNRISEALTNGWSHVMDEENRPIRRAVGTGRDNGVQYAYAMQIPEVFWQEDMAARHEAAQDKIDALKASPVRAQKGQSERSDSGKFYSPQEEMISVAKG